MSQKRNTWQKTAVREELGRESSFISAQALHAQMVASGQKLGLTTVYRALTDLVEAGEADALTGGDGETRYRICGLDHHHHLICNACGKTVEFELPGFEAATRELALSHGFNQVSHSIELFGTCAECPRG
jgi:Fur family transcriptional regulator, ferric uptake regulator